MTKLTLNEGRITQKLKTREALINKANELLKKGLLNSIEQVAQEAGISKATAYRYFTNLDSLKREASLQLKSEHPKNLFSDLATEDLGGRLRRLIDYHYHLFIENEDEFRLFLGSVISESVSDRSVNQRGGRRVAMIREALEPLKGKYKTADMDHMVNALSLVFGIESIIILKDLNGLSNEAILQNWRWTVRKITNSPID
jgi:AcrR family transcriptional regulator